MVRFIRAPNLSVKSCERVRDFVGASASMQTGVPTQMRVLVKTPNIAHAATPAPVFGDDATSFAQRRAAAPIIRQIEVHDRDQGSGRISDATAITRSVRSLRWQVP